MVESNELTQMVEIGTPASFRSTPAAILLNVIPDCRSSQGQATAVTEGQNADHCVRQQTAKCRGLDAVSPWGYCIETSGKRTILLRSMQDPRAADSASVGSAPSGLTSASSRRCKGM